MGKIFTPPHESTESPLITCYSDVLIPDLEPFAENPGTVSAGNDASTSEELPSDCICATDPLDCQTHLDRTTNRDDHKAPTRVSTVGTITRIDEPLPGLNKYGDVPNHHTQRKAARRRRNRELRHTDPKRYKMEMEEKKIIRDAKLRQQKAYNRRHGRA
ncbi:hypothetical protein G7054_g423 [Neopestalotiopsis clavispora]|nr:hypothetical protein G7054_g423 [Neopestalotiopsis clavispora]